MTPRSVQLHDRDAQTLLVHLTGLGGEDPSPDVGCVTGVSEVRHLDTFLKTGVTTVMSLIWPAVIQGSLVIRTSPGRSVPSGYASKKWRTPVAMALMWPGVPVTDWAIIQPLVSKTPQAQVLRLTHDGAEGRSLQGHLLLVDHRKHPAPEHLDQHRIQSHPAGHVPPPSATTMLSPSSTWTRLPGPMIAVDSRSSMIAGPAIVDPGPNR